MAWLSLYLGQSARGVKLNTDENLVPKSRMLELYLLFPIRLHGMMSN
jgi:hypothetical protein